jgi:hypothetical protein
MKRALLLLGAVALTLPVVRAHAQEQTIAYFYPLRTRRPVIERELELRVDHDKGRDGHRTEVAGAVEWPILPRWQVEVEVPFVIRDPREETSMAGVGDLTLENKVLVWRSFDWLAAAAVGVEGRFPTGSERRRLGGEASVEPFVTAGIALGAFDILASVAYEFNVNAHVEGPREQELTASAAAAWRLSRWFSPLVELVTATRTRASVDDELRHRTRVSIVPGLNARVAPGSTLRLGVELPLTHARDADYTILGGLVKEF